MLIKNFSYSNLSILFQKALVVLKIRGENSFIARGKGGYHSAWIDTDSHNFYEEILSLRIYGDILMVLASAQEEPVPQIQVLV